LGQGLALVLGGLVLKLVGFDQNEAIQTTETLTRLRIADILIPAIYCRPSHTGDVEI
jgi:glycoside/pentoside/hexuronide:cation symporter, GPH family